MKNAEEKEGHEGRAQRVGGGAARGMYTVLHMCAVCLFVCLGVACVVVEVLWLFWSYTVHARSAFFLPPPPFAQALPCLST